MAKRLNQPAPELVAQLKQIAEGIPAIYAENASPYYSTIHVVNTIENGYAAILDGQVVIFGTLEVNGIKFDEIVKDIASLQSQVALLQEFNLALSNQIRQLKDRIEQVNAVAVTAHNKP